MDTLHIAVLLMQLDPVRSYVLHQQRATLIGCIDGIMKFADQHAATVPSDDDAEGKETLQVIKLIRCKK